MTQNQATTDDGQEAIDVKNGLPVFTVRSGDTVRVTYDSAHSDKPQTITGEVVRVATPARAFVLESVEEDSSPADLYTVDFQGVRKEASGLRLSEAYSDRPKVTQVE